jgi:alkanesulfonate monooxygenase SsuD/methylene tetrahydromethanopterin reductase-like flavin-dependent oxidoreductase (luciferase family)
LKVFVELSRFAATASGSQFAAMVKALDDAGAYGVSFSDHLFYTRDGIPRKSAMQHGADPLTCMATVLALSPRLAVQSVVMNTAWIHPALLMRQFSQLAVLAGGSRVTAGLGAGWSSEEFDALGLEIPPFRARMDRLDEVLAFARVLFDDGWASSEGPYVTARDVPRSPATGAPPELLVGGGSDRLLAAAGRYADVLDLHGDPRHGKVAGATMQQAADGDIQRRAGTTIEDLANRIRLLRDAESGTGRAPGSVSVATQIWYFAFGDRIEIAEAERQLCTQWARIPTRRLDRCPYLLLGEPAQMAEALLERREAYGLDRISLGESDSISAAPADPLRFCREVLPLL